MNSLKRAPTILALFVLLATFSAPPYAQFSGIGDRIRDRVEDDVSRRIEQRALDAARRALDLAEDAIVCAVTDEECIEDAHSPGQEPVIAWSLLPPGSWLRV